MRCHRQAQLILAISLALLAFPAAVGAKPFKAYITGDDPGGNVIFEAVMDPAVPGSASVFPVVGHPRRLDGIDFLPGSTTTVVVGAQIAAGGGGSIEVFDVEPPTGVLAPLVADTNVPAPGLTKPSTATVSGSHVYYIENQFGFEGAGAHRIARVPAAGGAVALVFAGAGFGLVNFEGIEIAGGRLYFFAEDPGLATARALISIGLDGAGLWDGLAPSVHLGGLFEAPPGDGSDELDEDPATGILYGSNIVNGEIIFWDPSIPAGGFFISAAAIAAGGPDLMRLATMAPDGIRVTDDGWLVLSGLAGVIAAVDIAGVLADGPDDGDVNILFDDAIVMASVGFDDLTPLVPLAPVPAVSGAGRVAVALAALALGTLALVRRRVAAAGG